ncbi:hypothetical protein [Streptomyces sp. GF20]|uniref:hypothetical protein n=1 Tax=Streptomyces sp. GF20 TaxID=2692235 RepID=UPI001F2E2B50|nr:hypothetical protein [Streptomyces sp. GF20]
MLLRWAGANPWPTAAITLVVALALALLLRAAVRRLRGLDWPPGFVLVFGAAAALCTLYSGDTSWRFAESHLGMDRFAERAVMFAAGEVALLACAIGARARKRATAGDEGTGSAGVPGALVWLITAVQIVPAYAESGWWGGTVRAFFGPVMAGLLWHLAMGLEVRVRRPEALTGGLAATLGRELRARLLSRLGLAARERTAEQITRDRWTARAVDLAAQLALRQGRGTAWRRARLERRLDRAVGRAQVGASRAQRDALLGALATRLHSRALPTLQLASPWDPPRDPVRPVQRPEAAAARELRAMDPLDATLVVAGAHPAVTVDELRALLGDLGIVVSNTQVELALRAGASGARPAPGCAPAAGQTRTTVHARIPDPSDPDAAGGDPATPDADAPDADAPDADADRALLPDARRLDAQHRRDHGRPAPLRALQSGLRIGQARAQRMRALLDAEVQP